MKVSVCVVTYNQADVISRCLDSIVSQKLEISGFDFEIIVADDCSKDSTRDILSNFFLRYPRIIKLVLNEKNIGPFENYKLVHSLATGDYICHCDGDDYWLPGKLNEQILFLEKNKDSVAVYNNAVLIDSDGEEVGFFNGIVRSKFDGRYLVEKGNFLHHSSLMYRKDLLHVISGFSGDFIDYRVHILFSNHGCLGYINKSLSAYQLEYSGSILKSKKEKIAKLYFESFLSIDVSKLGFLYSSKILSREIFRFIRGNSFSFNSIKHSINSVRDNLGAWVMSFSLLLIPFLWFFKIQNKIDKLIFAKKQKNKILCVR